MHIMVRFDIISKDIPFLNVVRPLPEFRLKKECVGYVFAVLEKSRTVSFSINYICKKEHLLVIILRNNTTHIDFFFTGFWTLFIVTPVVLFELC